MLHEKLNNWCNPQHQSETAVNQSAIAGAGKTDHTSDRSNSLTLPNPQPPVSFQPYSSSKNKLNCTDQFSLDIGSDASATAEINRVGGHMAITPPTPEEQREIAAKRKALKKAQRELAKTLPPKPPKKPEPPIQAFLAERGALIATDGQTFAFNPQALTPEDLAYVTDRMVRSLKSQGAGQ